MASKARHKPDTQNAGHVRDVGSAADDAAPMLFAFARDLGFARAVSGHLQLPISPLEERDFQDGECKVRPMVDVCGRDVYLIAGLHGGPNYSVHDGLCRVLFLIGAFKTNGAVRVTLIAPYLCYLRKDRQTKARDPLTGRYVAELIEAIGADRVVVMEPHNLAAVQNAFRIPLVTLSAYEAMAQYFARQLGDEAIAVVSPDIGGAKRAELFRETLEKLLGRPVARGLMDKHRSMGKVSGDLFAGDVAKRHVIILDDLISSGGTVLRVARQCRAKGAVAVHVVATHGLFDPGAENNLADPDISSILITNAAWPVALPHAVSGKLGILDVSARIAAEIRHLSGRAGHQPDDRAQANVVPGISEQTVHPHHRVDQQEVAISPDNIKAFLLVPRQLRGIVIFAHDGTSGRHAPQNLYLADALVEDGYAVLLIDLLTPAELEDHRNIFVIDLLSSRLVAAIDWASTQPTFSSLPLGLVAAGTGSSAAFHAIMARPDVKAVVSIAGRPDLAAEILGRVKAPTRLIVGGVDKEVLRLNEIGFDELGGIKNLEIVPLASRLLSEPGALDTVVGLCREWFDRYVGAEGTQARDAAHD